MSDLADYRTHNFNDDGKNRHRKLCDSVNSILMRFYIENLLVGGHPNFEQKLELARQTGLDLQTISL